MKLVGPETEKAPITEADLRHYEGLVFSTALRYVNAVEDDIEDIRQVLRVKVWRALEAWDPSRSKQSRDSFVFSCVVNQVKDLMKRKRRGELFIEDLAPREAEYFGNGPNTGGGLRDKFEEHYLRETHEEVFGEIDEGLLEMPATLSDMEREICVMLMANYSHVEISERVGIDKKTMAKTMKAIRVKLEHWRDRNAELVAA